MNAMPWKSINQIQDTSKMKCYNSFNAGGGGGNMQDM